MNTVYIVDDDVAVQDSLTMLLKSEDFEPKQFSNPTDFLREIKQTPETVIILDLCMPDITGLEVIAVLNERGLTMPIIVITGHGDVPTAVRALKMGACEFLEKPFNSGELIEKIKECFIAQLNQITRDDFTTHAKEIVTTLTPRENEVLHGLVDGLRNKQIAYNMGISIRTVELHRSHVFEKLEAKSLSDIVKIAIAANYEFATIQ